MEAREPLLLASDLLMAMKSMQGASNGALEATRSKWGASNGALAINVLWIGGCVIVNDGNTREQAMIDFDDGGAIVNGTGGIHFSPY